MSFQVILRLFYIAPKEEPFTVYIVVLKMNSFLN